MHRNITLLDVGCGSGAFLDSLRDLASVKACGVDTNSKSVETARVKGLTVFVGDLQDVPQYIPDGADMVTLWHVLEHVPAPFELLSGAARLLRPAGCIAFSVPLSPQFYESSWVDPLNLPPHHLSRWTLGAIAALSDRLQLTPEFIVPLAVPYLRRVARTLVLQAMGPFCNSSRFVKAARLSGWLMRHPLRACGEFMRQAAVTRGDRGYKADLVLVILRSAE